METPHDRRRVAFAALAYLVVASLVATQFATWTDEEYTLATTAHGPAYAFTHALDFELQAPLYFVLEAIWREANASLFWARLPSLVCTAGLFFTFERIGRRIAPNLDPIWFAVLATLNPFVVFAGFEIRLYALALLIASVVWLLFDAAFISGTDRRARAGFIVVTIAGIYVQYFLAFLLVGFAVTLLVRGDRRALGGYALACVPIVLAALPLASVAHGQVHGYETQVPALSYLLRHSSLHPWVDFIFPYERDWDVGRYLHPAYDALVGIGFVAAIAARPRLARSDYAWLAGAAAIQATYLALVAVVRLPLEDRHYTALYVPLAVAAYAVARGILASERPAYVTVFGFSALLTAAVLFTEYRHLALPGDWRRVGAYLSATARPGDAIVVFAADSTSPLRRQYRGTVPIVPFPVAPAADVYSADALTVHSPAQAAQAFAALGRYRHLWFVSNIRCRPDEEFYGCAYVQPAIDRAFTIVRERGFYETRVEELSAVRPERERKISAQP
jgi:hypothetical protein